MSQDINHKSLNWLSRWLVDDYKPLSTGLYDFERLSQEVQACDVLLIEGRSRVADIIKYLSQSPWSHSILYIGYLNDIHNPDIRHLAKQFTPANYHNQPLVLEALFGEGIVLTPLNQYEGEHIRICRPIDLCPDDAQKVMNNSLKSLGKKYSSRQIFDLLRFLLPIKILPKRWLSSLFCYKKNTWTEEICSTMLVNAFTKVGFPVRPIIQKDEHDNIKLIRRNPLLFTPSDFDYSPYFQIIEYPILGAGNHYRDLNWEGKNMLANSEDDIFTVEE